MGTVDELMLSWTAEMWPMTDRIATVMISPHPDDVAYSVGGAILSGFFPKPFLIVTAFTVSVTAPCFDGVHDVATVSSLRASEDEAFAKKVNSQILRLDLPDAGFDGATGRHFFRLMLLSSLLYGWPPPRGAMQRSFRRGASRVPLTLRSAFLQKLARFDRERSVLSARILSVLSEFPDAVLVSPLGLGNHPDHIVLASACKDLRHNASRMYYYEDLPYAAAYTLRQIQRYVEFLDKKLRPISVEIDLGIERKISNLLLYSSQVSPKQVDSVLEHARTLSPNDGFHERIWTYSDK